MSVVNVSADKDQNGVWAFRHLGDTPSNPNQLKAFICFDKGIQMTGCQRRRWARRPVDLLLESELPTFDEFEITVTVNSRGGF